MTWLEENKTLVIAFAAVAGISYFGGGAVTAHRHKGVISAGQLRFKEQFRKVKEAFADFKAADRKLKRSHGRGVVSAALLGSERERAIEQKDAREELAKQVRLLRSFEKEWSSPDRGNALTARTPYFGWTRLIGNFESFKRKLRAYPLAYREAFPDEQEEE